MSSRVVHQAAATVDDVRDVALALVGVGLQQRYLQPADHARRIIEIEQERAQRILAHRADAVRQHQPAGLGLDRRAAVAELHVFPGVRRLGDQLLGVPEVQHVRVHQIDVLVVLPREHRVQPPNLAGEQREALVPHLGAVERADPEPQEVVGLEDLRQDHLAVERGVGRVVADRAVVVEELDEPGVLDAVGLGRRRGEDDPLGDAAARASS